jgi:hypothetical protein
VKRAETHMRGLAADAADLTKKILWGERRRRGTFGASYNPMECPMPQLNDLSRSLAALNQDSTLVVVIEMGQSSWLVRAMIPGVARQPLKKLAPDEAGLSKLLHRWREPKQRERAGRSSAPLSSMKQDETAFG